MGYPFSAPSGDEEDLNQQFAGYLYYSLQIGPELLNQIHHGQPLSHSDDARVVANQDSPLPYYTETGPNREIDWVIADNDQLVGYESKYSAPLSETQLRDELKKLRLNADERDVALVVVTMHTTPVPLLERFEDEPVYWISWFTVFRRLRQIHEPEIPAKQRPILRMILDLFEVEDMHPFTGFDHTDKLQYRYFIRDLRQELIGTDLVNPGKVHTSTTRNTEPSAWKRLVPKRLDVPFIRESREGDWSRLTSYLTVVIDTETHEVHVGVVFNLREVEPHQKYVYERLDDLIDYANRRNLELWASMNSFNQWELGIARTSDPTEMRRWLKDGSDNSVRVDETNYKKAIFVHKCSSSDPAALVQEAKTQLLDFYDSFLDSDDLYNRPTLEE